MQIRRVVIENEEGTAKREYVIKLFDSLLEVLKNDPPFLVAICVTFLFLILVVCAIYSVSNMFKYFFLMIQNIAEYVHNIIILVIYTKRKGNDIDDETCKKIDCHINEKVINFFDWRKNQKQEEKKDAPACRSDSAFKKRSKKHDK